MKAMAALDPALARHQLDRSATGAPVWPLGLTGSITHTDDFASAAVASTAAVVSLGIDTEWVMSEQQARNVGNLVASSIELQRCRSAGIGPMEALTLVFSAKESIFKCLHPLVGRLFDFDDVRLVSIDAAMQTFHAEIVNTLDSAFPVGTVLEGHFAFDHHRVHTGLSLPIPETGDRPRPQAFVPDR